MSAAVCKFELSGERLFAKFLWKGQSSDHKNEYYIDLKDLTVQRLESEIEDIAKFFLTEKFNTRF